MGRPHTLTAALLAAALVTACSATTGPASPPTSPAPRSPAPTASGGRPFVVTEMVRLPEPWAMSFLPGSDLLAITERSGHLHVFDPAGRQLREVAGVPPVVHSGQGGLGDIVPAPDHAASGLVYLSWVEPGDGGSRAAVGRARLVVAGDPRLEDLTVIWQQSPAVEGSGHFSHRIAVSPDGQHLFVSSGDRQKMTPAQDLGSGLGKIVRLTLDGAPAPGNPFTERGGVSAEIWSYGHRNPLGLAFDAEGRLWSSEMGPQGGDEVNLIVAGGNYGWPRASNGSHYGGEEIPDHTPGDGFTAPAVWWTPSVSPGSLMIYSGSAFPAWTGDAFIGALSGQALIRVDLDGEHATEADRWDMGQRIREVEQGPDGSIWVLEDTPGGRLLHLTAP